MRSSPSCASATSSRCSPPTAPSCASRSVTR
jgi:hypothetical protein